MTTAIDWTCQPLEAYRDTALLKTLDDEALQQVWNDVWQEPTMLCEAFQDLWDAVGDNTKAGDAIKNVVHVLIYNSPLVWEQGCFLSDDGQDFTRIGDDENLAFWNDFLARS